MFLVSHPVGNQNVRELLKTLEKNNLLSVFITSISYNENLFTEYFIPKKIIEQIKRREFKGISEESVKAYPLFDIMRLLSIKVGVKILYNQSNGILRNSELYRYIDNKSSKYLRKKPENIKYVYGYDSKCLELFTCSKNIGGIKNIYEAAFGYTPFVVDILKEEAILNPSWSDSIPIIDEASVKRQSDEVELADVIVVASSFAKKMFLSANITKNIEVINYGAPIAIPNSFKAEATFIEPLKIIYIGALSQQKGISYFFDALNMLPTGTFTCRVIGMDYSMGKNKTLRRELDKYEWHPSLPNERVLSYLEQADVLVLPSLAEAFGLVVLEALSRGVTVIVSENCGAADLITEENGFVIPIRSSKIIFEKLTLLNENRELLVQMKNEAIKTAKLNTWKHYSTNLNSFIREFK